MRDGASEPTDDGVADLDSDLSKTECKEDEDDAEDISENISAVDSVEAPKMLRSAVGGCGPKNGAKLDFYTKN